MRKEDRGLRHGSIFSALGAPSEAPISLQVVGRDSFGRPIGRTRRFASHAELEDRKDALAACGRRAREELGGPVPDRCARFSDWGWSSDLNQRNCGGSHLRRINFSNSYGGKRAPV